VSEIGRKSLLAACSNHHLLASLYRNSRDNPTAREKLGELVREFERFRADPANRDAIVAARAKYGLETPSIWFTLRWWEIDGPPFVVTLEWAGVNRTRARFGDLTEIGENGHEAVGKLLLYQMGPIFGVQLNDTRFPE
jgi:hypothetical protein